MTKRRKSNKSIQTLNVSTDQNVTMAPDITCSLDALLSNLPNFEGKKEQDVEFFLNQFEQIANATTLTPQLKTVLLKAKLAGHAKQLLLNSPELRDSEDFDDLKNQLKELFKSKKTFAEIEQKFTNLSQLPNQSIDDFVKTFNISAQKYLAMSGHSLKSGAKELLNTIKLTKFIQSIRPDISFELQKMGPDTFEQAVKSAQKIEIAFNNNKREINAITEDKNQKTVANLLEINTAQAAELKELRQQINNIKLENPNGGATKKNHQVTPQQEEKSYNFCHICKTNSHKTENCFYNTKQQQNQRNFRSPRQNNFQQNRYSRPRENYSQRPPFKSQNSFGQRPRFSNSDPNAQNAFMQGWGYFYQQPQQNWQQNSNVNPQVQMFTPHNIYSNEATNVRQTSVPQLTYGATQSAIQSTNQAQANLSATPNVQQNPQFLN